MVVPWAAIAPVLLCCLLPGVQGHGYLQVTLAQHQVLNYAFEL